MKILKYTPMLALLAACALDPVATADYSGLGDSEVAKTLRYSAFTSSVGIDYAVGQLVNKPDILAMSDPRGKLEQLGFTCVPTPPVDCTYDGSAKTTIMSPDASRTERYKLTIHIAAKIRRNAIEIASTTKRENY